MWMITTITQAASILVVIVDLLNLITTIQVTAKANLDCSLSYLVELKKQTTTVNHQIKLIRVTADISPAISFFVLSSLR